MELTNDPNQAEVVIIYLLSLRRALLVDKRRSGATGPYIEIFPQQELLLEGRAVEAPVTPEVVHLIERQQLLPGDQLIMQSYFRQVVQTIAFRLRVLRPSFPTVQRISIGPHFAPVVLLAVSDLWRQLLAELKSRGEDEAVQQAKTKMNEIYACEVLYRERVDPDQLELLSKDFRSEEVFRRYG